MSNKKSNNWESIPLVSLQVSQSKQANKLITSGFIPHKITGTHQGLTFLE